MGGLEPKQQIHLQRFAGIAVTIDLLSLGLLGRSWGIALGRLRLLPSLTALGILVASGRALLGALFLHTCGTRNADFLASLSEGFGGAVFVDLDILGRAVARTNLDSSASTTICTNRLWNLAVAAVFVGDDTSIRGL
ncbi:hypothetical protein HG531_013931 [Fusarium graminearum]|nr:hypothetical protein HG531_013931 [Fusarium graminearum]